MASELTRLVVLIKIMAKINNSGNLFEQAIEICWLVTMEDAVDGERTKFIIKDSFEAALKYGNELESEEYGENILVKIENMTMESGTYFLDTETWKL